MMSVESRLHKLEATANFLSPDGWALINKLSDLYAVSPELAIETMDKMSDEELEAVLGAGEYPGDFEGGEFSRTLIDSLSAEELARVAEGDLSPIEHRLADPEWAK
jgi:hypothetical protein